MRYRTKKEAEQAAQVIIKSLPKSNWKITTTLVVNEWIFGIQNDELWVETTSDGFYVMFRFKTSADFSIPGPVVDDPKTAISKGLEEFKTKLAQLNDFAQKIERLLNQ